MEGWVSIHRQIMKHWTYEEKRTFSKFEAWIDLILMANHKDTKFPLGNEIIEAKRGEVITSEIKLMERWKWGKSKTRSFLDLLEQDGMIAKKSDRKKTTLTIIKYSDFQDSHTIDRPLADRWQTAIRPQSDTINNVSNDNNLNNTLTPTTDDYVQPMNAYRFFEEERFGMITSAIHDRIEKMIVLYSELWVIKAMDEAAFHEKRYLPYVSQILDEWKKKGHPEPWTLPREPKTNQQRGNVRSFPTRNNGSSKQQIPVAKPDTGQAVSEERLAEIRAKAKKLDEQFNRRTQEVQ